MSLRVLVGTILNEKCFAVTGVSRDPEKYGYLVYKRLKSEGYTVYPVNPNASYIESDPCYPSLDTLPEKPDCVVTVTPPEITVKTVHLAGRLRIPYIWMQPGSESLSAYNMARADSLQVVSGGPCILVELSQRQK